MMNQNYEKVPDAKRSPANPQKEAGFISLLTFWWMNGILQTGAKRPLEESDFLPLQEEDETQRWTDKLQRLWSSEMKCVESRRQPRLWKSVLKVASLRQCGLLLFTCLLEFTCRLLQPLLLGFLVSGMMAIQNDDRFLLYMCAAAMVFNSVVGTLAMHQFCYRSYLLGMQLRAALKGVVYLKILRLGQQTLRDFTTGQVVSLISNDVQRMEHAPKAFIRLFTSLLDLIVSACLLWYFVGWQVLVGVAFLLVLVLFTGFLAHIGGKLRKKTAAVTDRRILLMNEVVSAIRAVKINAWEWIYRDKIREIRREEINVIRHKSAILSTLGGLFYTSGVVAIFVSVTLMAATHHLLTPVDVFILMALMNVVRVSVSFQIGYGLQHVFDAGASLARIQNFLLLTTLPHLSQNPVEEDVWSKQASVGVISRKSCDSPAREYITGENKYKDGDPKSNFAGKEDVAFNSRDKNLNNACVVSNLTLYSNERNNKCILRGISFEAAQSSLVVLSGSVGSGKSSLLSAINQEVAISEGNIFCTGTIAYVSQTPWVFPGTIRENILFGEDYDEKRFKTIVEVCALQADFRMFPGGDQTIVGERGVLLSGGQQARISLARAVYADADVYLLDDPLCAVDANVGEHIFQKCICSLLSTKTRIFVTHQISHMKMADQIVLLFKGDVLTKGSFEELIEKGVLDTVLDLHKKSVQGTQFSDASKPKRQSLERRDDVLLEDVQTGLEIPEEDRRIGAVSLKLYWKYLRAGISPLALAGVALVFLFTQSLLVTLDVWLSHLVKTPLEEQRSQTTLATYSGIVCAALCFVMLRAFLFYQVSLSSSEQLHDRMTLAILKAPVLFFDTNPVGRILNRFSKDVGCMDEILPTFFLMFIQMVSFTIAATLLPALLNPWLFLAVVPVVVSFVYIVKYYLKSSRELKRLESICRSPIFSHISETLNGLDTIRSRRRQKDFIHQFYRHQDKHNQAFYLCLASVRWMGVRVDFLSALFVGAVAFSIILIPQDAALAGLALVYVIEIVDSVQYTVQLLSDVENQMTSVERVMAYTEIEPEPGYDIDAKPPENWPRDPSITVNNVSLRYYPGGPQVLRNLDLHIEGKAKIGVAGRTGAGKSSVTAALLRMPEAEGAIMIDGVNLATINLQESRRCVSVLSQKPFLFSGPLRINLDPLAQHEDADLWRVLEVVQLKTLVDHLEGHLDYEVSEGGENFSVGERQLLCLARVLLEQNKVLILDEPTAHVDPSTEQTIQTTVRDQLRECTVITVAHRLNTIRDCDKILVMDGGMAVEFDSYEELVRKNGVFAGMAKKQS